ncbi:MAG: SDR family NAD(P)-dependent oxidoreductase [Actinobacteria bacterium]|nr:SDR family NAD(P)-dependent oxidoreductase [Actinomycetota bacterium]
MSTDPNTGAAAGPLPAVAVVTGASRGLGAGIAERLAGLGVRLGLCARTRPGSPAGSESVCDTVDVRDHIALDAFGDRVTDELGPIDLWINNAGILGPIGPLRDRSAEDVATGIDVNLTAVLKANRSFARRVRDRGTPGTLVNITSGAARTAYAGWAAYGAAKAGVDQMSRVLALEEATHGLSVFAVAPGVVDTDMQAMIRATPIEDFPALDRFVDLARTGSFNSPGWVADRILELYASTRGGPRPDWQDPEDPVVVRVPSEPRR